MCLRRRRQLARRPAGHGRFGCAVNPCVRRQPHDRDCGRALLPPDPEYPANSDLHKGSFDRHNSGQPGELASAGVNRLRTLLQSSPKIVLIMEGVNDLNARVNNPDDPNDSSTAAAALRGMVQQAKGVGATVALATLPPQRPGWLLLTGRPAASPSLVDTLNAEIRRIASEESVQLVDVAAAFNGDIGLISGDGLHPTQAGYDLIAQTFFNLLRPIVSAL